MRDIWIHVHIPKCGGTSIADLLRNNFKDGLITTNSILNDYQYTSEQIGNIAELHPYMTCLTGHKISLALPFQRPDTKIRVITWVRDPLERFISHYFYHRNKEDRNRVKQAEQMNLSDYTDWALNQGHQQMYINGQTKFLMGAAEANRLVELKQLLLEQEIYVFPLEKLQESFLILHRLYPDTFRHWKIPHLNKSVHSEQLDESQQAELERFFQVDRQLYQLARQEYERHKSGVFADDSELHALLAGGLLHRLRAAFRC